MKAKEEGVKEGKSIDKYQEEIETLKQIVFSDGLEFFLDQLKEVHVRIRTDKNMETMRFDSKKLKDWIINVYNCLTDDIPKYGNIAKVLSLAKAIAVFGDKKYELSIRVVHRYECIWYDLTNDDGNAVRIDKTGWGIVKNPPIMFKRSVQKEQVIPEGGGDARDLLKFVNISDEKQKLLFLVSTIANFIPDIPRPIQVYFGSKGAAKSTAGQIVKSIIDPSKVDKLTLLNETRELTQQLDQHYLLLFDNLDILRATTSDTLCRAVTGGGLCKRKLYTDSDNIIFNFKRAIIINGINLVANKPDLLDRSLLFEMEQIDGENRRSEDDLWREFNSAKPKILGAIFEALSKALVILPTVKLDRTPRMADFAKWGCAIAESIGYSQDEFIEACEENYGLQNRQAIEESPVASAIILLMDDIPGWNGTSQELLRKLKVIAKKEELDVRLLPKSPSALSRKVNEVRSNLFTEGVKVEKSGQREWRIERA